MTVLEQKLFSVFEVCYLSSLSNEKFNQLLTLLNGEDPTTSNALTSEIQQLVLGKEESAQAHCIFRPH